MSPQQAAPSCSIPSSFSASWCVVTLSLSAQTTACLFVQFGEGGHCGLSQSVWSPQLVLPTRTPEPCAAHNSTPHQHAHHTTPHHHHTAPLHTQIFATILSLITEEVNSFLLASRSGRTPLVMSGHILLLNWNEQVRGCASVCLRWWEWCRWPTSSTTLTACAAATSISQLLSLACLLHPPCAVPTILFPHPRPPHDDPFVFLLSTRPPTLPTPPQQHTITPTQHTSTRPHPRFPSCWTSWRRCSTAQGQGGGGDTSLRGGLLLFWLTTRTRRKWTTW